MLSRHSVVTFQGNTLTCNLQLSQLAEPLWTDPGLESRTGAPKLSSNSKKKKSTGGKWFTDLPPKSSRKRKKPPNQTDIRLTADKTKKTRQTANKTNWTDKTDSKNNLGSSLKNNLGSPPSMGSKVYTPTPKLHFQELKSPNFGLWHNFQEYISECILTFITSYQILQQNHRAILHCTCTFLTQFCAAENAVCWSYSTVQQTNHFTTVLPISEFMQVSPFSSTMTNGHFSWYSFFNVWNCLIFSYTFPLTWKVFANGVLILKLYLACILADAIFPSGNFGLTSSASCLSHMWRPLMTTNLHNSFTHVQNVSDTHRNNQKSCICSFFFTNDKIQELWEAIHISRNPCWLSRFLRLSLIDL